MSTTKYPPKTNLAPRSFNIPQLQYYKSQEAVYQKNSNGTLVIF